MKISLMKAIRILSKAQKESVAEQRLHIKEINDSLFEVFKNCSKEQFMSLCDGVIVSSGFTYDVGHWKGDKK